MAPDKQGRLVLIRHGLSEWNEKNIFTGWQDPPIVEAGWEGARAAGKLLKAAGFTFDHYFESDLLRAQQTMDGVLQGMGLSRDKDKLPITRAWEIKERDYGDLAKKNKDEVRAEFGEEQFLKWRRSYAIAPPNGESLKDTAERVLPYFKKKIIARCQQEEKVLVSAHGNSIRAMLMTLDDLTGEEIVNVEIPWTLPIIYDIGAAGNVISRQVMGYTDALAKKFPYFPERYQQTNA